MDDQGFDRLARGLAGGTSRRLLLGSAVAGAATLAGVQLGAAKKGGTCRSVSRLKGTAKKSKTQKGWYTATAVVPNAKYGNLNFKVPGKTTFADITGLSSDFAFGTGSPADHCGAGSPRFVVFLKNGRCPYVQFPPNLCNTVGAEGNTGELVGDNTPWVWIDDLCGSTTGAHTYDGVLAEYATEKVKKIVLVTDSSNGVNDGDTTTVELKPCVTLA